MFSHLKHYVRLIMQIVMLVHPLFLKMRFDSIKYSTHNSAHSASVSNGIFSALNLHK